MALVLTGAHLLAAKNTTDERQRYSFAETCNMIRSVQDNGIQNTSAYINTFFGIGSVMTPAVDNKLSADALVELWKYFADVAEKDIDQWFTCTGVAEKERDQNVVYLYGRGGEG